MTKVQVALPSVGELTNFVDMTQCGYDMSKVTGSSAFEWLDGQSAFHSLLKAFERKQKHADPSDRYVQPFAWFMLMDAIADGLLTFADATPDRFAEFTSRVTHDQLRQLISALDVLRVRAEDGLNVWPTTPWDAEDGPVQTLVEAQNRLEDRLRNGKQPYRGGYPRHRAATEVFALSLTDGFGEASPALVKPFAALIGYSTAAVAQFLRRERQRFQGDRHWDCTHYARHQLRVQAGMWEGVIH